MEDWVKTTDDGWREPWRSDLVTSCVFTIEMFCPAKVSPNHCLSKNHRCDVHPGCSLPCSWSGSGVGLRRAEPGCGFGSLLCGSWTRNRSAERHPRSARGEADSAGFHRCGAGGGVLRVQLVTGGSAAPQWGRRLCRLEGQDTFLLLLFLLLEAAALPPSGSAAFTKTDVPAFTIRLLRRSCGVKRPDFSVFFKLLVGFSRFIQLWKRLLR